MNTSKAQSRCRVVPIHSGTARVRLASVLALLLPRVINLAELTRSIAADRNLRRRVMEAASREHGWPQPRVDEAIVLLGQQRLCALLTGTEMFEGKN